LGEYATSKVTLEIGVVEVELGCRGVRIQIHFYVDTPASDCPNSLEFG